jgi:hypothetical protein
LGGKDNTLATTKSRAIGLKFPDSSRVVFFHRNSYCGAYSNRPTI